MDSSTYYNIRIISPTHPDLNNTHLALDPESNHIHIDHSRSSPAFSASPPLLTIRPSSPANPSVLLVHDASASAPGPPQPAHYLLAAGPSGRGPYQLRAMPQTRPFGVGARWYHDSWSAGVDDGHWVAVREDDEEEEEEEEDGEEEGGESEGRSGRWSVYWITPRPYNAGDFAGRAVRVDLELVRAGGDAGEQV
ncbi:hypothetical protein B0J12DRAFT_764759 [Macrophomina phaseolina]|uniref:Uncharacterized protein n=1 Tax=Macrophomina phaseolina TaxID=35725 RepID=A0ABQ8FZW2_9PEZI|nr:hypothetical protein B0J12DRAFT_764759 [Macrophomina phaseolina]